MRERLHYSPPVQLGLDEIFDYFALECSVADYPLPDGLPIPAGMPQEQRHIELRVTGICDKCRKKESRSRK